MKRPARRHRNKAAREQWPRPPGSQPEHTSVFVVASLAGMFSKRAVCTATTVEDPVLVHNRDIWSSHPSHQFVSPSVTPTELDCPVRRLDLQPGICFYRHLVLSTVQLPADSHSQVRQLHERGIHSCSGHSPASCIRHFCARNNEQIRWRLLYPLYLALPVAARWVLLSRAGDSSPVGDIWGSELHFYSYGVDVKWLAVVRMLDDTAYYACGRFWGFLR
ncbi:hypothetical protein BCR44DRAFT_1272813 [Catenaria anguillulae PL171]|uniref:Uncharacterized protein n=1 Tax=Catenaria anguillulae PL171 TaxID=765915 RepID=A0A1Y2HAE4_9FUNG|nr:hypothetical protein BCR44DRAFT_1272813 [Catenaria anguillulae PL171]